MENNQETLDKSMEHLSEFKNRLPKKVDKA